MAGALLGTMSEPPRSTPCRARRGRRHHGRVWRCVYQDAGSGDVNQRRAQIGGDRSQALERRPACDRAFRAADHPNTVAGGRELLLSAHNVAGGPACAPTERLRDDTGPDRAVDLRPAAAAGRLFKNPALPQPPKLSGRYDSFDFAEDPAQNRRSDRRRTRPWSAVRTWRPHPLRGAARSVGMRLGWGKDASNGNQRCENAASHAPQYGTKTGLSVRLTTATATLIATTTR